MTDWPSCYGVQRGGRWYLCIPLALAGGQKDINYTRGTENDKVLPPAGGGLGLHTSGAVDSSARGGHALV